MDAVHEIVVWLGTLDRVVGTVTPLLVILGLVQTSLRRCRTASAFSCLACEGCGRFQVPGGAECPSCGGTGRLRRYQIWRYRREGYAPAP